ncbi:MAG: TIR domain-containing protein, partial [Fusicatenibacter sp.]
MITFKCKMCGRDLIPIEGNTTVECKFCSTMQTIATADSEKEAKLFNRANRLRMAAEFDKAAGVYESIVSEFPEEAEAYWGLCLCAYGIEYVDDPASGRKIPTCQRTLPESIMDSSNFEMACEYADGVARKLYREEAKAIDRLQRDILAIVANEEPYDVFICYKETDNSGNRTVDSVLGRDIYDALTAKGMKVFFARITLEDKLGQQYEPYIYAALHSAKVMLALGTSFEHFDAVWVKNEWSRFLDMASRDKTKTLIPCYKDIDAYDIPKEFRNLQAQDMNKLGWLQDLTFVVEKLCGKNKKGASSTETAVIQKTVPSELENLLKRGNLALENKQWKQALVFFDAALNLDAEYAIAYLGIACAKNECASKEDLMKKGFFGRNSVELSNVMRFADSKMKAWVEENLQSIEEKKQYLEKRRALQKKREKLLSRRFVYSSPVMGLKTDGTVVAAGKNEYGECNVSSWRNIAEIYWCGSTVYGLKIDGTVVAAGKNEYGECNVSGWRNIAEIYWRGSAVYGLKTDGTVVAAGENKYGQCNVSGWRNIAKIYPHGSAVYGLKTDGTVVAAGDNE